MSIKRILVTGGGGYVGNVLCRDLLERGYQVRCVDNFHKGNCDAIIGLIDNPMFEFHYGDVTNAEHCKEMWDRVDGCIHLAAIVGAPACDRNPHLAYAVNHEGTKLLLNYRENRPFIFASTGSVYGKIEGICTEDSPLNTLSDYGLSKLYAEESVRSESNTVSFRFATGFGVSPNMRVNLLVNDLVYQAVTNRALNIFQGDARRTFISVKDMSRAFIWGFENCHNLEHNVFNCGSQSLNWTKRELAEYISKKTGCFVSYAETHKDPDQRDYEVDYSRLTEAGFKCKFSMEDEIDRLIDVSQLVRIEHQYI